MHREYLRRDTEIRRDCIFAYKEVNLKNITKTVLSVLLCFSLGAVCLAKEAHWYVKKTTDHTQPPLPSEFSFIEQNGGIYLDKEHSDYSGEKVIYLTFDAGYENGNIAKILDTMKAHGAVGTFFVLENLITRNTELARRMFDEGHTVANHTMSHKNMAGASREVIERELKGLEKLCLDLTGHEMAKLYRPPEGSFSESDIKIVNELGYKTVFWSCAYADWDNNKQPSRTEALDKLLSRLHNGEILLLHPTSETNAEIMDEFLTRLKAEGFRFGDLSKLCES